MTTSELARYVYGPIIKDKDAPPFKPSSWQRTHIGRPQRHLLIV